MFKKVLIACLFAIGLSVSASAVTLKYLDIAAAGTATGADWTNAWTTFDAALAGCLTAAASDTVICYVRDGVYTENSSSGGALYIRQNNVNLVTFRHDPADATPDVTIRPARTGASSAEHGTRVYATTANLTFEDIKFHNSEIVANACDATTGWLDSADLTLALDEVTVYEGTGSLSFTKDNTASATVTSSKTITAMYQDAGGNVSYSLYIKDAAALAKLATTGCVVLKVGSDSSNTFNFSFNKASFAVGWNHMWGYPRTTTTGTPTTSAIDYLEVNIVADAAATTWADGDFLFDDINANMGSALNLNYSATGVNISDLTFLRCTFDVNGVSSFAPVKYSPNNTTGTNVVDGLNFINCTFTTYTRVPAGATSGFYLNATKSTNYVQNLVIRGCTFRGGSYNLYIDGAQGFKVQYCKGTYAFTYAFNIPLTQDTQATVGTDTYGVIEDSYWETTGASSHAAVIGTNQDNGKSVELRRCYLKSPSTNGLVVKGSFNTIVESNYIETAATGGVGIMFKGVKNGIARNNYILAAGGGIGGSDTPADYINTNCRYYNNYVKVTGANGRIFSFVDHSTQGGGNVVDYNAYDIASSANANPFGTIGTDTTVNTLAEAQTEWADYSAAYATNDAHSVTAVDATDRFDPPDTRFADIPIAGGLIDIGAGFSPVVPNTMTDYYGRPMKLSGQVPIGHVNRISVPGTDANNVYYNFGNSGFTDDRFRR